MGSFAAAWMLINIICALVMVGGGMLTLAWLFRVTMRTPLSAKEGVIVVCAGLVAFCAILGALAWLAANT